MSLDLRSRLLKDQELVRKAGESAHIIANYGVTAWFDLAGYPSQEEAIANLERGLESLIEEEDYESACILRDAINPLKINHK